MNEKKTHLRIDFVVREVSSDGLTPDEDLRYVKLGDDVQMSDVRSFFERCGNAMATVFRSQAGGVLEFISTGANKILVIKVVREIGGYGLKDAKDLVEAAPGTGIVNCTDARSLEHAVALLNNAGAKVTARSLRDVDTDPNSRSHGSWSLPALATYTRAGQ